MKFTKSELEMICKYAATTKEETVRAMKGKPPAIQDELTRVIIRNAAGKDTGAGMQPVHSGK